jgi:dsDNA-binding SOS-regulon protein
MAEFPVAFTSDEWEALKTGGHNSTARMQHILREALCVYLAANKEDFGNLSVLMLEKTLLSLYALQNQAESLDELQGQVEKTIAEKEQSDRQD